ncbi:MAG TPA: hypothetical protein VF765_29905 [Polyangiaceae bacterium]
MLTRALQLALLAALAALVHCGFGSWPNVVKSAAKPSSPLAAPADKAVLVFVKNKTLRSGGWPAITVLDERHALVAQFQQQPGWLTVRLEPGKHAFFIRTVANTTCRKIAGEFAAGKVYVYGIFYDAGAREDPDHVSTVNVTDVSRWLEPTRDDPAGPLGFHPYLAVDDAAARAMLADERGGVADCIENANDWAAQHPVPAAGDAQAFESIDFGS